MAQTKSTTKETKSSSGGKSAPQNPIKMAQEAAGLMEEHVALKPSLEDMVAQQIAESQLMTAAHMAKRREKEAKQDLDSMGTGQAGPQPAAPPMFGMMPTNKDTTNPFLAMLNMLPDDERVDYIKTNGDSLMGAMMGGVPGNQFLQRVMNTGGNDKKEGMGDMAQMMLAMVAAQGEQQRNMIQMMMNVQQMVQAQTPPNNGNEKIMQAITQLAQVMAQQKQSGDSTYQDKLLQSMERQVALEKQHAEERMMWMQEAFEKQIETMQKSLQARPDILTQRDIPALLSQIKEVTGVELKAEQSADTLRARHEHEEKIRAMDMENEWRQKQFDIEMAGKQVEAQKWSALGSMVTPMVDAMRAKSRVDKGGSATAKGIKKRAGAMQ